MTSFRITFAAALCLVLAACGGGGGGGSIPSGGGAYASPTPSGGANMASQSVQREDAQSGISGVQAARSLNGGTSSVFTRVRALRAFVAAHGHDIFVARRRFGIGPCEDGQESSTTSNANDTVTLQIDNYYDAACTSIESAIVWTASQSGDTATGPATLTDYSQAGTVTETATATITFVYANATLETLTGFSILITSDVANGNQLGESGIACNQATASSLSCGVAAASNTSSGEVGANVSATETSGASTTLSMSVSAYLASAQNALSIAAAAFPDWTISPASDETQSVAISGSVSGSTVSLTVTDATNGGAVAITGSTSGTVSGTITRDDTGATVASFTIDAYGDGTVTYGNGTQASIADYAVQG